MLSAKMGRDKRTCSCMIRMQLGEFILRMKAQRPSLWFWVQMVVFVPIAPFFFVMQLTKECIQRTWPRSYVASVASAVLAPLLAGALAGLTLFFIARCHT